MLAVLLALAAAAGYGGSDYAAGLAARRASVVRVTVLVEVTSAAPVSYTHLTLPTTERV